MKTLILNPTKAPFTNTITAQRAVEFNLEERGAGEPHKAMALMFATLLEELYDGGCLFYGNIGKILSMEVTAIEETEHMPPFENNS